jgi:hypothetical protein
MRSFDRGARFAFASRVFPFRCSRGARFFVLGFFSFKKETTALFPAENSPLLVCRQNRIGFCFTRAPLPVRESMIARHREDIRDEKHSMRANRPRYASLSLRGGSNVVVVVGKDHFFIIRESSATAVRPFFFIFVGPPPDTPFWGFKKKKSTLIIIIKKLC